MAGCKIVPSGPIRFANGSITAGTTPAILSTLTQTSSATPSPGNKMFWDNSTNDYAFKVLGGTYSNTYVINRNDSKGEQIWAATYGSGTGLMSMDNFHNYQHWTADQRLAFAITNNHTDDHTVSLKISGGTNILSYYAAGASGLYDPWSGAIDYYVYAPGSGGAYDPGAVNTGWTIQIDVNNTTQTMPSFLNVNITDFHTRDFIYGNMIPLDPGNSWNLSDTWNQRYFSVFYCIIDIS